MKPARICDECHEVPGSLHVPQVTLIYVVNKTALKYRPVILKMVLFGDKQIGKTCLINKYINDTYSDPGPTMG